MNHLKVFLFLTIIPIICGAECVLKFSKTSLSMPKNEERNLTLFITDCTVEQNITFGIQVEYEENLVVSPNVIQIQDNNTITSITIQLRTTDAGEAGVYTISSNSNTKPAFIKVEVYKDYILEIISIVIGWTYFVTWTISFYPQVYVNHTRKSVVGLNFDFVVINITGYTMYALFNVGLYWIPLVRQQYEQRYPLTVMSILPNDIFFALHGFAFTLYIGLQCLMYERGGQRVSWFGVGFHVIVVLVLIASVILCFTHILLWLDFLYICSYIKLVVTFCKYGPQAIMNYKRRSTKGWSIGAVLLDVVGGFCSIVQMFMNVYNYNENLAWLLSNPTKLWLGVFSLLFDLVFVIQHYCLYYGNSEEEAPKVSEDKIKFEKENNNCIKA